MSVHQLKDGRWIVQYRDKSKKSGYSRKYFGRGLEGEKQARSRNDELNLGSYTPRTPRASSQKFEDLATEYMAAKLGTMEKTSMDALLYKLDGVILPEIGHFQAVKISPRRMDKYIAKRLKQNVTVWTGHQKNRKRKILLDENGDPRKITRSTVHREISDILAILNWAVKREYIKSNPLANYEKPKRDDAIIEPPTLNEIRDLIIHSADHLCRCLLISFYTGLRPGEKELLSLKWTAVDLEAETILVRSSRKGGPRSRLVPIHPAFLKMMTKWKVEDKDKKIPEIITYRGRPVQRIKTAFNAAKKRAGITRRLRIYDFRHSFATTVLGEEGDLKSASEIMGHSRTETTMKIYQHTNTKLHRKTINKLPELTLPD